MKQIFYKLKYPITAALFLTIVFISFINYQNTKKIIKEKYNQQNKLVENSILDEIKHVNNAYRIAEKQLNEEMREYSLALRDKYRRNPDVATWNLKKLKQKFDNYNIYIINRDLKVIRTTFKPDKGLDFSSFPSFSKLLKKRLKGDSFAVDRLNLSTQTGKIKKYSYIPTPDHKYLLELGIEVSQKYPALKELNIFTNAERITKKYRSVEEVSFYKYSPKSQQAAELRNKKPYVDSNISEIERKLVKKTYVAQEEQTKNVAESTYTDKYLPVLIAPKESTESWWNSFVVGIKYNEEVMLNEIEEQRNLFLINALIMVVVFIAFIIIIVYLLNEFEYMAYYDKLTGLANRDLFTERVDNLLKVVNKENDKLAILFLDIDNFKEVNDNFGHDTGDRVLAKTAVRLKDSLRENDIISRLGGDEFTIAISDINSKEEVNSVVTRIINAFNQPLIINESKFFISISMGISCYPVDGERLEELLKKADHAMYRAKKQQQSYLFYESEVTKEK